MYVSPNFKTKKDLKKAVDEGRKVAVYNPGPFGDAPLNGKCCVEGPHYPQPHRWYANVEVKGGYVVSVK